MGKKGQAIKPQHNQRGKGTDVPQEKLNKKYKYDYTKQYGDASWPYAQGRMDRFGWILVITVPVVISLLIGLFRYWEYQRNLVVTPAAESSLVLAYQEAFPSEETIWGNFRPGIYLGMKAAKPRSPVIGLMWLTHYKATVSLRHWCKQEDKLPKYGWNRHDGQTFGTQEVIDQFISLNISLVHQRDNNERWTARVEVTPHPGAEQAIVSLFFYVALDGEGLIVPEIVKKELTRLDVQSAMGADFTLEFSTSQSGKVKNDYLLSWTPGHDQISETVTKNFEHKMWDKSKHIPYFALSGSRIPQNAPEPKLNLAVRQVTSTLPVQIQADFSTSGASLDNIDALLLRKKNEFNKKFEDVFHLKQKHYSDNEIEFAMSAMSNMIGGIGHFYGSSVVSSPANDKLLRDYWNASLLTAVPSRSFFPRGFLWDEGFHNILILEWDWKLSLKILSHWLDLLNVEGWIPREQILGSEARARVPIEFIVQRNDNANPPAILLPLEKIVDRLIKQDDKALKKYLEVMYSRLKLWYNWYNTSQTGVEWSSYRWRGRDPHTDAELNPKTLSSGFDDYPRASHPSEAERHLDLRCWMMLASKIMSKLSSALDKPDVEYQMMYDMLKDEERLTELHWSEKHNQFGDYGMHSSNTRLQRAKPRNPGQVTPLKRHTLSSPTLQIVAEKGYISLFPFLLRLLSPQSEKLGQVLQRLDDPSALWSKYGLRSLAKTSKFYKKYNSEHDPPYWRGNIWININYLACASLHYYKHQDGPYASLAGSLYDQLRKNLINNVYSQYVKSGYIWENYNDDTGEGQGCHPFTGWSALVVNIMAEIY